MSGLDAELAPKFAPFLGMAGIAAAMIFGCIGAAYGTAKSGISIIGVGTFQPDIVLRCIIPVIMSGIIAVYSLVIAVLIADDLDPSKTYTLFSGVLHLASGLTVGLTGIAAGYCIGIVGDAGVRAFMEQRKVYTGMVLILIFAEVLGLYGLIVAILLNEKSRTN
ncbi:hypothetical protein FAUST_4198 [Fusarium austroamericanum]|uniref:V-type proton ATPase proteolipid subunit n=1 Tax=Fusarium austroamericanum TaxID=282268 RepID=A0AAN6C3A3_FUSAU|nr:hypothetical protein FAUST_4198 [Fusarium austroamericanum]